MWLCSKEGFFSVVQKKGAEKLDVRTRVRADLIALSTIHLNNPNPIIHSTTDSDYPYRIFLSHDEWAAVLMRMAQSITYPNFKRKIKQIQGHTRARFYSEVWYTMLEMGAICDDRHSQ